MPVPPNNSLEGSSRRSWFSILVVLVAGLILRIVLWNTQSAVSVEGAETILTTNAMGSGLPWDNPQSIGYALLVRALGILGMPALGAARILDLSAGMAAILLTWMVARHWIQSWWLAALPALAMALLPLTVRYSLGTQPEMIYLALVLGAITGALSGRFWLAGFLIGCAAQVRPEAVVILAGMLLVLRSTGGLGPLALGALITFGVGWMFQGVLLQEWMLFPQITQEAATHWMDRDHFGGAESLSFMGRIGALLRNTLSHGGFWVPVLALGALSGSTLLLAAALAPALLSPFIHLGGHPRFVVAFLPFLWILAAVVVARLKPAMRLVLGVLCLGGFALSAGVNAPEAYTFQEDGFYPELHFAGDWLKKYIRPGNVVTGELPHAAFYAGARYRPLPKGAEDYDQAVDAIVASGADFVVFHQQALHKFEPLLTPLVEDKPVVWHEDRLEPVYFSDQYMDGRTLVYRVVRPGGLGPLPTEGKGMRRQIGVIPHGKDHEFHGHVAMQAKKFKTAASEYLLASNRNPGTAESAYALNNRAWCLLQNGEYDKAKGEAHRAIEILPHQEDFIGTMIEIVSATGQDKAVTYWQGKLEAAKAANAAAATDTQPEDSP